MTTARVTRKGQITIPVAIRKVMHVCAGDRVEFVEIELGRYELIAAPRPITAIKGMFGRPAKSLSIEQMNAAIAVADTAAR